MRSWFHGLAMSAAVSALCLHGVASHAGAPTGALTGGSLEFTLGTLPTLTFDGDGSETGSATGSTAVTLGAGNAFAGTASVMLTAMQAPPLSQIIVKLGSNSAGSFTGNPLTDPSGVGGGVFSGTAINKGLGATLLKVPVKIGAETAFQVKGGGVTVDVAGDRWTSGAVTITGLGEMGTETAMATGMIGVGTPGTVTLVAPIRIATNISDPTYVVSRLILSFDKVPEPALPLMLAAGASTLALIGGRKLRRRG